MAFLSAPFLLFVAATVLATASSPPRLRPWVLTLASLVSYAAGDPGSAVLLVGLTAVVHQAGLRLERTGDNWPLLAAAVAGLFAVLFAFKVGLVMPLGLSYLVFKLVAYLVEVYWKRRPAERSLGHLTLYGLFFPQIVCGPIQRPGSFLDQLGSVAVTIDGLERGLRLMLFGLFQKAVADQIGVMVSAVYRDPASFSSLELLIGLYAFAFQLYMDFAGLTDMAIGLGALFGIETPQNFDRPFFAPSIQDFWRRWHITLSSWLTDYLFTPLWHRLRNWGDLGLVTAVLANMLAIGLWHGARWTFVVFGLLNGIHMTVSVLTRKSRNAFFNRHPRLRGVREVTSRLFMFHAMAAFFVFIRADSLATAVAYFKTLVFPVATLAGVGGLSFASFGVSGRFALVLFGCVVAAEGIHWLRRTDWAGRRAPVRRGFALAVAGALVVYLVFCRDSAHQEFLYAQF